MQQQESRSLSGSGSSQSGLPGLRLVVWVQHVDSPDSPTVPSARDQLYEAGFLRDDRVNRRDFLWRKQKLNYHADRELSAYLPCACLTTQVAAGTFAAGAPAHLRSSFFRFPPHLPESSNLSAAISNSKPSSQKTGLTHASRIGLKASSYCTSRLIPVFSQPVSWWLLSATAPSLHDLKETHKR